MFFSKSHVPSPTVKVLESYLAVPGAEYLSAGAMTAATRRVTPSVEMRDAWNAGERGCVSDYLVGGLSRGGTDAPLGIGGGRECWRWFMVGYVFGHQQRVDTRRSCRAIVYRGEAFFVYGFRIVAS